MFERLQKKAINFTKAMVEAEKHFRDTGEVQVSREEYQDRVKICQSCDLYEKFAKDECGECLCYVKTLKAWGAAWHCPLYKWPGDELKINNEKE
jgi:hypothetical protein